MPRTCPEAPYTCVCRCHHRPCPSWMVAPASRLGHLPASLGDLSGPVLCAFTQTLKTPLFYSVCSHSSRTDLPGFDHEATCVSYAPALSLGRPSSRSHSVCSCPHAPPPPQGILIAPFPPLWMQRSPGPALRAAPTAPPGHGQASLLTTPFTAFRPLLPRASSQGASFGSEELVGCGGAVSEQPRLQ